MIRGSLQLYKGSWGLRGRFAAFAWGRKEREKGKEENGKMVKYKKSERLPTVITK